MTTITGTIGTTYTGTGGTALAAAGAGSSGHWTREFRIVDAGKIAYEQLYEPHSQPVGMQLIKAARPGGLTMQIEIVSTVAQTVASPGTDAMEQLALDEWRDLNALFLPYTGQQYLAVHRHNHAGDSVLSVCLVEIADLPGALVGNPGVGDYWHTGIVRYPVTLYRPFPFWWDATEDSDTTTEVGASAGTCTVAVPSTSVAKCGAKLVIGDVSGSVTKLKFSNTTTGDEFTVNKSGGFANDDCIDWFHTNKLGDADPLAGCSTGGYAENASNEVHFPFWLAPGNNEISVARIAGAGTCTVTVKHQPLYGSI